MAQKGLKFCKILQNCLEYTAFFGIIGYQFKGEFKMNKSDLVKVIAEKAGLTQKDVAEVVETFIEVTTDALVAGKEVAIAGLGKFVVRKRAARQSVNPRTKEVIKVPASKAPTFRAAKALKDAVNKK